MADPTVRTITVDGVDVAGVAPVKLRLSVGSVIQNAGSNAPSTGARQRRDGASTVGPVAVGRSQSELARCLNG